MCKNTKAKRFFLARPLCVDVRCLAAGNEEDGVCANTLDKDSFITWFHEIQIFTSVTCQCMHYTNKWTHEQMNPSADPCVHTSNVLMHVPVIWFREIPILHNGFSCNQQAHLLYYAHTSVLYKFVCLCVCVCVLYHVDTSILHKCVCVCVRSMSGRHFFAIQLHLYTHQTNTQNRVGFPHHPTHT